MPLCPACHTEQDKRKNGACPACHVPVDNYQGYWYRASIGSPNIGILRHFEQLVSKALSVGRTTPVIFSIPGRSPRYSRELVQAERFLRDAGHDYDLTIETIDILFTHPKFAWKTRDSLIGLAREFPIALAIAVANRKQAESKDRTNQTVYEQIMQKEDVFA